MTTIRLAPEPDDLAIVGSVADVLHDEAPLTTLAARPMEVSDAVWTRSVELGWHLAGLAEEDGGAGFDIAQEALMNQAYGRGLAPLSLLASALHGRATAMLGQDVSASGRYGFAVMVSGDALEAGAAIPVQLIDAAAGGFVLIGANGVALLGRNDLLDITPVESLDPTFTLAHASAKLRTDAWLGVEETDLPIHAQLMMAAQLAGMALAATEMASEYAKVREQFGRPIGSFQAIAHMCADAIVRARASSAQVVMAALALRDGWPDADLQIFSAARMASESAFLAATTNIQVHGAMGYSAESGVHLYLKRAQVLKRLLPLKAAAEARLLDLA
jgi:alkylation response protein AidB-like acyl-CoA dehydrogenase